LNTRFALFEVNQNFLQSVAAMTGISASAADPRLEVAVAEEDLDGALRKLQLAWAVNLHGKWFWLRFVKLMAG